jgi:hypothetical protein
MMPKTLSQALLVRLSLLRVIAANVLLIGECDGGTNPQPPGKMCARNRLPDVEDVTRSPTCAGVDEFASPAHAWMRSTSRWENSAAWIETNHVASCSCNRAR